MTGKPRRPWLRAGTLALLPAPVLVLTSSIIYKHAIGCTGYHEFVDNWIRPRAAAGLMEPLERRDLSEYHGKTKPVEGFPLPADWTARDVGLIVPEALLKDCARIDAFRQNPEGPFYVWLRFLTIQKAPKRMQGRAPPVG
jgi:hypothetical protein